MESPQHYWNTKHPKVPQVYEGRYVPKSRKVISTDVRRFIWANDTILNNVLSDEILPAFKRGDRASYDGMAWCVQQWVTNGKWRGGKRKGKPIATYVGDKKARGHNEFWQYPNETLALGTADCEDGSFLIASLLLVSGVPAWRVRVAAGWVKAGEGAEQGGHAYCCYIRETDNQPVVLDWCYLEDSDTPVPRKRLLRDKREYGATWFSMNNLTAWSHVLHSLTGRIRDYKDPRHKHGQ